MADDRKPDRIAGHEIDFTWTDGPTKGETHRHRFEADGSVRYWQLKDGAPKDWIVKGVTVLDREKELKKFKKEAPAASAPSPAQ